MLLRLFLNMYPETDGKAGSYTDHLIAACIVLIRGFPHIETYVHFYEVISEGLVLFAVEG